MRLWELKAKDRARIFRINHSIAPNHLQRLLHLGIQVGVEAECIRVSPFSGPKSFWIGDSVFSLDKEIACLVEVIPTNR